jgi:hypothetical protein
VSIAAEGLIIDAFANAEGLSAVGSRWRLVSDQVMAFCAQPLEKVKISAR